MKNILSNKLLIAAIILVPMLVSAMEKPLELTSEAQYQLLKSAIPSLKEIHRIEKLAQKLEETAKNNPAFDITDEDLERLKPQDKKLLSAILEEASVGTIQDIVAAGANANIEIKSLTPLQRAINNRDFALVSALLQADADPNKESYGFSPLDWATIRFLTDLDSYQKTRKLLLEKGAVPTPEKAPVKQELKEKPIYRPR